MSDETSIPLSARDPLAPSPMSARDPLVEAISDPKTSTKGPVSTSSAWGSVADVEEALRDVVDPELGINVVDLGLVYGVAIDEAGNAVIDMTLTSAACPLTDLIEEQTSSVLDGVVASAQVNWVWLPPWGPDQITDDGRAQLRAMGFNV